MQRPLYGLAVDLTPQAVIGPAPPVLPLSAVPIRPMAPLPGAPPAGAAASATQRQRHTSRPGPDMPRLLAAAVAFGALAITLLMAATRSDPRPATAAQTASAEKAAPASQAPIPVAAPLAAKPSATEPRATGKNKSSAPALTHRPADPWESRSEPADADLAATLERLRQGIR